jgi:Poly(ADP-ribose) polymerase catalytic domain
LIELNREESLAKYNDIKDRVLNYIKASHNWKPRITKIEEVINPTLESKFEEAKKRCFDSYKSLKFHGTGKEGIENIPREGFKLTKVGDRKLMFGRGIYFATDSSKSAQEIYTKGTNKLLLCEVLLGKHKTVTREQCYKIFFFLTYEGQISQGVCRYLVVPAV